MRLVNTVVSASFIGALFAAVASSPASAQSRDYVYADTFGNLIIESAAGYKRILVGRAQDAERAFGHIPDKGVAPGASIAPPGDCFRPAFLVKGRGYMYGFDQGIIPPLGAPCL